MYENSIQDSGARHEFASGMIRDLAADKTDFTRALDGPMFERWVARLEGGAKKYCEGRERNWMKADGPEELARFRESAFRHMIQWLRGDTDEDHASAVFFNINGAEYVRERLVCQVKSI